jgi:hypothetical protein
LRVRVQQKEQLLQMLTKKFERFTPTKWNTTCFCDTYMEIVNFSTKQKISSKSLINGQFAVIDEADFTLLIMNHNKIKH